MDLSVPPSLAAQVPFSPSDFLLKDKVIVILLVAMRHRDYVYKSAYELGAKLIFVDTTFADWALPYAYDTIQCHDATDACAVIPVLEEYLQKQRLTNPQYVFDAIVSIDDYSVVACAHVCAHFNMIGLSPAICTLVKHKYNLRVETAKAGIYTPRHMLLNTHTFTKGGYRQEIESNWTFPIVLKPVAGVSSRYVRKVRDYAELEKWLHLYTMEAETSGENKYWSVGDVRSPEAPFMIEELMIGQEVDIDLVVQNGQIKFMGIADNFPAQGPDGLFMESGGAQPSLLPQEQQNQLFAMTQKLVSHFGSDLHGVFHFEAMYTPHGPSPIEFNLRLGGSEALVFMLAVYGVNLGLQIFKLGCGIPIEDLNMTPIRQCVSTNILAVESGYISRVGFSPEQTAENEFYMGGMHRCWEGQPLLAPPLGYAYCAWMVVSGKNLNDAMNNMKVAKNGFFCDILPYSRDDQHSCIPITGSYYLEGSEREKWGVIKQIGAEIASFELRDSQ